MRHCPRGADLRTSTTSSPGGCAVTHKALEAGDFTHYYANDLDGTALRLFTDAVEGKLSDERRWISREDFAALKDTDPYVQICWSFGNNQRVYLYSREVEPWKRALHHARVLGDRSLLAEFGIDSDGSRADIKAHHEEYKQKYVRWWLSQQKYSAEELDALIDSCKEKIEAQEEELRQYLLAALRGSGLTQAEVQRRLGTQMSGHYFGRSQWAFPTQEMYERMRTFMPLLDKDYNGIVGLRNLRQSLGRLQSLERLHVSFLDYRAVGIRPDSLVYCDIPYRGTGGYQTGGFDHEEFYDWCGRQEELVVVSEYSMPDDRFVRVWHREKAQLLNQKGSGQKMEEGLFVPRHQARRFFELTHRVSPVQMVLFPDE